MPPASTPHTSQTSTSWRGIADNRWLDTLTSFPSRSNAYHLSFLRQKIIYQELSLIAIHFRKILITATEVPVLR